MPIQPWKRVLRLLLVAVGVIGLGTWCSSVFAAVSFAAMSFAALIGARRADGD